MDKSKIELQTGSAVDSLRITELINSVYRGENSKKGWTTEADFLSGIRITDEKIKEIIGKENDVIILAVYEGNIIACVHLENSGTYSYLGMLSVDVDCQDKGIGRLLISECERYTKEVWGLDEVRMKVISRRKELVEYYNRRGYSATGELEEFGAKGDTFGDTTEKLYFQTLLKHI